MDNVVSIERLNFRGLLEVGLCLLKLALVTERLLRRKKANGWGSQL